MNDYNFAYLDEQTKRIFEGTKQGTTPSGMVTRAPQHFAKCALPTSKQITRHINTAHRFDSCPFP
ncbi:MAG: hypothetical protein AAF479_05740, partial [Pseudomonadota bacterium]